MQETTTPSAVPLPLPGEHNPPPHGGGVVGSEVTPPTSQCLGSRDCEHLSESQLQQQGQLFQNVKNKGSSYSNLDKLHLADQNHSVAVKVSGPVRPIPQPRLVPCLGLLAGGACMLVGRQGPAAPSVHPTLQPEPRGSPSGLLQKQMENRNAKNPGSH